MAGAATCPQLLLLDLHMPGCDGLDVLTWRRTDARWSRLPVVVFSSSSDDREIGKAYDLGANSYAIKPTGLDGFRKFAEALCSWWLNQNRVIGAPERNLALAQSCSPV
jgi:DNA-binding response OmpR family regulator